MPKQALLAVHHVPSKAHCMLQVLPESVGFARMDDGSEEGKIRTLIIEGTVTDTDGNIIEGAKVEVWHANSLGNYSFFDKSQSDFNLRRSIFTDQDGKYVALTTMPVGYGCPPEGTTQFVLEQIRSSR